MKIALNKALLSLPELVISSEVFEVVYRIYSKSHSYLAEWKTLLLPLEVYKLIFAHILPMEINFKLKGLGLWLIDKLLEHASDFTSVALQFASAAVLQDLALISLIHPSVDRALQVTRRLLTSRTVSLKDLFHSGIF